MGNQTRSPGFFPDDLNQSPAFDPSEPEPIPDHASRGARDFDQSWKG